MLTDPYAHYAMIRISALVLLCLLSLLVHTFCAATDGETLAKDTLKRASSARSDQDILRLHAEVKERMRDMPPNSQADYAEYMAHIVSTAGSGEAAYLQAEMAFSFLGDVARQEEQVRGISRLLSSSQPTAASTAKNLFGYAGVVTLPTGERVRDLSVFKAALNDPAIPQDAIVNFLFDHFTVESASWFLENATLEKKEREMLQRELSVAKRMEIPLKPVPFVNPELVLSEQEREQKLREWAASPSLILRLMAKGFLKQCPPWQTTDLELATQFIRMPKRIDLLSANTSRKAGELDSNINTASSELNRATPTGQPTAEKLPSGDKVAQPHLWLWIAGLIVLGLIVGGSLMYFRGRRRGR